MLELQIPRIRGTDGLRNHVQTDCRPQQSHLLRCNRDCDLGFRSFRKSHEVLKQITPAGISNSSLSIVLPPVRDQISSSLLLGGALYAAHDSIIG